jgi:hypothetical protein
VKISPVEPAFISDAERRKRTVAVLRIWREVRGLFDLPECVDARADDAKWLDD